MLFPFLAAAAVAATFAHLGAMSVQISILTAFLQVMAVALLIAVRGRPQRLPKSFPYRSNKKQ